MPALPVIPPMSLAHVVTGPPALPWTLHHTDPATGMEYACPVSDTLRSDQIQRGLARESDFTRRPNTVDLTPDQCRRLQEALRVPPSPHLQPMNTLC